MKKICKNCQHYKVFLHNYSRRQLDEGECHAEPPSGDRLWYRVYETDFCGYFKEKEKEEE